MLGREESICVSMPMSVSIFRPGSMHLCVSILGLCLLLSLHLSVTHAGTCTCHSGLFLLRIRETFELSDLSSIPA